MSELVWPYVVRIGVAVCLPIALAASLSGCKADTPRGVAATTGTVTISGMAAATAVAGKPYAFQPTASSTTHDMISFSVQNKPGWATLSTVTGRLTGTPSIADTGTYGNITISVSNGASTARLAPFAIAVVNPATTSATASATVLWTPPTQNLDGTALTNLAGYHIYYGNSANALTQMVSIGNPTTTTHTMANLPRGTWFFAVAAYTADKVESDLSSVVSKSI